MWICAIYFIRQLIFLYNFVNYEIWVTSRSRNESPPSLWYLPRFTGVINLNSSNWRIGLTFCDNEIDSEGCLISKLLVFVLFPLTDRSWLCGDSSKASRFTPVVWRDHICSTLTWDKRICILYYLFNHWLKSMFINNQT